MEVTNEMRAEWAKNALTLFTMETYYDRSPEQLTSEDREDAVADLICDLLHYANSQGFDCNNVTRRSIALFKEEVGEAE